MGDLTKLNEFMRQFLPLLLRGQMDEKRVQLYLDKALKEQEAYGSMRSEEAKQEFIRKIMLQLIETGQEGVEGLDRPLLALLERLPEAGITDPSIPTLSPGAYGRATAPFEGVQSLFAGAMEDVKAPSEEEYGWATRILGTEKVTEFQKEFEKKRAGEAKLGLGKETLELGKGRLAHDQAVLAQRKTEFAIKGAGKDEENKENLALFSLLKNRETTLNSQLIRMEKGFEGDEYQESDKKALEGELAKVREQKLDLVDKMIKTSLSTERINGIIQKLKSAGATALGLEKNRERNMEALGLTEIEYEYIKFRMEK